MKTGSIFPCFGALFFAFFVANVQAAFVCTKKPATLKVEPSSKAKTSWLVGRYMPFIVVQKKGTWIQVKDLEGEPHWVRRIDVSSNLDCVVVKVQIARLYREPANNQPSEMPAHVDRYTPFRRLHAQPGWYQVQDDAGRKSWIKADHVWRPVTIEGISF